MPADPDPVRPPSGTGPDDAVADRLDLIEHPHGTAVADPYRWLEDAEDERTVAWSLAQDRWFAEHARGWPGRQHLQNRIAELLEAGTVSVPVWRGDRQFVVRRDPGQEHAVLLTVDPDGTSRVLIDPVAVDPTGTTTLDAWQPSKEGDLVAYQLSEGGTEESVLRVMRVSDAVDVDGPIDRARYSPVAWLPGGESYFYVRRLPADQVPAGEEQFHRRVWWHRVGTDPDADIEVFGAGQDPTTYFGVSVSRDGRWLTVSAAAGTEPRNDLWVADLTTSSAQAPELVSVQEGVDAQTSVSFGRDGRAYVFTDRDAPRGRILVTEPGRWDPDDWQVLVDAEAGSVLDGWAVLDGDQMTSPVLLVASSSHAVGRLTVHDLVTGRPVHQVALPGLGSLAGLSERPEGGHEAWFGYTDHTTPSTVWHLDGRTGDVTLWAEPPGRVTAPDVRTEQVEYASADGTVVRMFVMSRADAPALPAPTILYGYGGFGVPLTPGYSATTLAWVEAGGRYVVANLRGGTEEGEDWHRDGMRANKQNVFDDFHAAAEWLIDRGLTTPAQLVASGGSNGGLLVGAALTQRPDLFAGVICAAPLLDMLRYEEHGLGPTWSDEYGRAADPEEFGWLHAYSPYHRVVDGVAYPAVLFTVFDGDSRVDPCHARKMAAALQHASASGRPVLVRREAEVGHGARSVSRTVGLSADTLAFAAWATGLTLED